MPQNPRASEGGEVVKKLEFAQRTHNDDNGSERLKDQEAFRLRMNKPKPAEKRLKMIKDKWNSDKTFFEQKMKPTEDDLIGLFVTELDIQSLAREDLRFLFNHFRDLREINLRLRNIDCLKLFRCLVGEREIALASDLLLFLQEEAKGLQYIDKEDYMITGISNHDKEKILESIELDPDDEEDCDKWVRYILFFSNPSSEWSRMRKMFEKTYFKFLDTAMVQALVNNDQRSVKKLLSWRIPKGITDQDSLEVKLSPIVRADRIYSSYRRNNCPQNCQGHRGKLLLLMIRMRHSKLVELCLSEGISATSQCCSGQIRSLFWDTDRRTAQADEEKDSEEGENTKKKKKKNNKSKRKQKAKITLRSEYEMETPLSTAVVIGDLEIVKTLLTSGANPVGCRDAAIRAGVHTVMEIESNKNNPNSNSSLASTGGALISTVKDSEFIFQLICSKAYEKLKGSRRGNVKMKGYVPPSYCTVALLYQAVLEELWQAEEALTRLRTPNRHMKLMNHTADPLTKILARYNIKHSLPNDHKSVAKRHQGRMVKQKKTKRLPAEKRKFGGFMPKLRRGSTFSSSGASSVGGSGRSISASVAKSVGSIGTVLLDSKGDKFVVKDMNEDLCYVLIKVIDKLIEEALRPDAATHARALNGIVTLLEKHNLYLDDNRFDRILKAVVTTMRDNKAGDAEAVVKIFLNKQFRHYLEFDIEPSWENRHIEKFIKYDFVKLLLKLTGKGSKTSFLDFEESKETLLESVLLYAGIMDLPALIKDLHSHSVDPDKEAMKEVVVCAAETQNMDSMEMIVRLYGKHLLREAFDTALANSDITAIQKVLDLDTSITNSKYSLVENYIENALLEKSDEDKEDDEKNDLPPVEIVLDFFFICAEMTSTKIHKILTSCFSAKKQLNFGAVAQLLVKAGENEVKPVDRRLLEVYIGTKEFQYDNKDDEVQVLWLQLLLDLYKCAANAGDESVQDEFNDRIIAFLEMKPDRFMNNIKYESDDEEEVEIDQSEVL